MSDAAAPESNQKPSAKMERLIDEALSIVKEFSSEPGMDLYFKHCRKLSDFLLFIALLFCVLSLSPTHQTTRSFSLLHLTQMALSS